MEKPNNNGRLQGRTCTEEEAAALCLENPGECVVCRETYDDRDHQPRIIPCGHTYCYQCLAAIVRQGKNGFITCHCCKASHKGTCADQFPINYNIVAVMIKNKEIRRLYPALNKNQTSEGASTSGGKKESKKKEMKRRKAEMKREKKEKRDLQTHLCQYQAQLHKWEAEHLQYMHKLHAMVEENKAALFLLEQVSAKIEAQQAAGEERDEKMHDLLRRMKSVSTAQEAVKVISQVKQYREEERDWEECQEIFPDFNALNKHMQVLSERFQVPLPRKYL
ncbi:hypothetical protein Pmani_018067 [Petrolisthes manimaculis]|uniref:RING-type domain-containing protein n=1 Tax=Petrolisthes manimaculis TaxID=1843537 RepID=A0AAE1PM37_9EUCA|nr:hypothetical protein Pmani_018067 [Petrolisthes manimaculis]